MTELPYYKCKRTEYERKKEGKTKDIIEEQAHAMESKGLHKIECMHKTEEYVQVIGI